MKVTVAGSAGFCRGVQNAFDKAVSLAEKHGKVYTIGALIHNEGVVRYLEERGVYAVTLAEARALPAGSVALIRAHGIPKEDEEFLRGRGIELYDATCPVVKRIHSIVAERSAAGDEIIIVGDRNHDEVLGAASYGKTSGWCRTARSWNFRIIPPAWCSRPPFLRTNSVKSAELRKIRKKRRKNSWNFQHYLLYYFKPTGGGARARVHARRRYRPRQPHKREHAQAVRSRVRRQSAHVFCAERRRTAA